MEQTVRKKLHNFVEALASQHILYRSRVYPLILTTYLFLLAFEALLDESKLFTQINYCCGSLRGMAIHTAHQASLSVENIRR